jgi:hypothetical protein
MESEEPDIKSKEALKRNSTLNQNYIYNIIVKMKK